MRHLRPLRRHAQRSRCAGRRLRQSIGHGLHLRRRLGAQLSVEGLYNSPAFDFAGRRLQWKLGVAVDGNGNVFVSNVATAQLKRSRRIVPAPGVSAPCWTALTIHWHRNRRSGRLFIAESSNSAYGDSLECAAIQLRPRRWKRLYHPMVSGGRKRQRLRRRSRQQGVYEFCSGRLHTVNTLGAASALRGASPVDAAARLCRHARMPMLLHRRRHCSEKRFWPRGVTPRQHARQRHLRRSLRLGG